MNLTEALKNWLVENKKVDNKDVSDDVFSKAAAEALCDKSLSAEDYFELSKEADDENADEVAKHFQSLGADIKETNTLLKSMIETSKDLKIEDKEEEEDEKDEETEVKGKIPKTDKKVDVSGLVASQGGTPTELGQDKAVKIRVKEAADMYDMQRKSMVYPSMKENGRAHQLAGQRVKDFGRALDEPSEQDAALAGAWAKFQIASACPKIAGSAERAWEVMPEHDKNLLHHLTEKGMWDDSLDPDVTGRPRLRSRKGYAGGMKALIDDSTSGGLEAAPIVFDDMVITTPLLYGELYPLVNTVPLARGRRVEGVSTGTVTSAWGGVDDTAITLFSTATYVSAFDTTIFRWQGSVRIGLDFLSDTPIDFGRHITGQYGERLLEDLDDVIAVGNGTTQPEGVINKTGATSVSFGGSTSIGNYESLRFGVVKAEHRANVKASAVFCGTETSYSRVMALNVGTTDARRLFSMSEQGPNYDGYTIMGRPYKINESLSESQLFYAIMARYRMYRRKGLAIRTSTEGDTLIRRNEMLIVAMSRWGGQMERGACCAVVTNAPA